MNEVLIATLVAGVIFIAFMVFLFTVLKKVEEAK